jgi:2-C-methyl-D-erythritol 4-phosphate cytidylyltransferase
VDSSDRSTEIVIDSPRPLVERRRLEEAASGSRDWVVITDRSGHHPSGAPPRGGILVSTKPVTEAVKVVDGLRITGSVDRSDLVEVVVPVVLDRATLVRVLAGSGDPVDVVAGVAACGGPVVPV